MCIRRLVGLVPKPVTSVSVAAAAGRARTKMLVRAAASAAATARMRRMSAPGAGGGEGAGRAVGLEAELRVLPGVDVAVVGDVAPVVAGAGDVPRVGDRRAGGQRDAHRPGVDRRRAGGD